MDYEKAYKDALARMELCVRTGLKITPEYIFPELKESEDEKLRIQLLNWFKDCGWDSIDGGNLKRVDIITWLEKQGEPQPYRGNADTMRKNLIKAFKSVGSKHWGGFDVREIIHFLESKDAIKLEKQGEQKPADEPPCSETLDKAIDLYYYTYGNGNDGFDYLSLDKFRDIVHTFIEDYGQKSTEWSEDDEKIIETMCKEGDLKPSEMRWLKFLKDRVQPHWKPTDEQMQSLYFAIITYSKKDDCKLTYDGLNSLYDNLKKL